MDGFCGALVDGLTGWALFAGLLMGVGSVAGRWVILPLALGRGPAVPARLHRRSAELGIVASLLTFVGLGLYLFRQVREFRDPFVPLGEDLSLLMSTAWGTSWIAAAVAAVLLLLATVAARSGWARAWWLAAPIALALAVFPGLTGHASGADNRLLALILDGVHVSAAGAWIGGLALVLYLEAREDRGPSLLPSLVPAFSRVAMLSVVLLTLSGVYAAWSQLESLGAVATTAYGRILSLKLLLVAVVVALGARNFRILTPRLGTDTGDEALRRSATVELAVAQLVLIVTAVLVRTSPTGH